MKIIRGWILILQSYFLRDLETREVTRYLLIYYTDKKKFTPRRSPSSKWLDSPLNDSRRNVCRKITQQWLASEASNQGTRSQSRVFPDDLEQAWAGTGRGGAQGLRFPMTSPQRNFPRLVLLDSVTTARNRGNGFGSNSTGINAERNLTSAALLEFQRRPKRDSRFFHPLILPCS